jgi:tRNA G18 (ribose-2'-O)-methylase SpoU
MPDILIEQLDDPRLEPYRDLKTRRTAEGLGAFIAEGHRVVERLLTSRYPVESILATDRRRHLLDRLDLSRVPVLLLREELASQLVGYNFHGGIMACGLRQPEPPLESLFSDPESLELIVVCPRTTDPDNLGGVIRLCRAFGARGLILGGAGVAPFSRRVIRVSMGNAFHLPILQPADLGVTLDLLKSSYGFELAATVLADDAVPLAGMRRPRRLALVFGNEADGLEPQWVARCDHHLQIPMSLGTDSLNVTIAAGIFLYHFAQVAAPAE